MALKDWSLAIRDFLSHAGTVLALLASLVVPSAMVPVPTQPAVPTKRLHHQHQQNLDGQAPNDENSQASWLASRGYRDSFGNDDEVRPDPKENILIDDDNDNNDEGRK